MKNKLHFRSVWAWIKQAGRKLWSMLSRRLWLKLLSLFLAIILWNYVVSNNASLTRNKTISGINGYVTSQSSLETYGLALMDDPAGILNNVTVRLEVAQSQYALASADNIQVTLDLSRIRTAGTQEVALRAVTSYGRVLEIVPSTLTLSFETLDSRSIPVNVQFAGVKNEGYWYNISRTNPATITVSGAGSVVRSIAQARVYTDVTGADASYNRAEPYVLLDGDGNEVSQTMLTRSSSSITVNVDVYPTREISISNEIDKVVSGQPAEGYAVSAVTIQPESITVAAERELLDGISELTIEPISVDGLSQSFTQRAKISLLDDFKNVSAEQVYVNVTISEETVREWIDNVSVTFIGKADNLQLEWQKDTLQVYVIGPRSAVAALAADGIPITVDLTGLTAGTYDLPLGLPMENYPDISFEPETSTVSVTLTQTTEE